MSPTLWHKTWRDLRANWAQSLALVVIVALGVASFVALSGAYRDLGSSYQHTYDMLHFADVTFRVASAPSSLSEQIAAVDGVDAVTAREVVDTGYLLPDDTPIRARLIGIPADAQPAVNQVYVLEGQYLSPDDPEGVLVESHFAKAYDLHPGDTVTPIILGEKQTLTIRGVVASPEYLIVSPSRQEIMPSARTFGVFFLPLETLQQLTHTQGQVNEFCVRFAPGADGERVVADIQQLLKPYNLEATTLKKDQPSNAALTLDLEGYRELSTTLPALILLVAALSLYVMLGRMVRAQRPQIGLMKALGYSTRQVTAHYLVMAVLIGAVGAVLGAMLGSRLAAGITSAYAHELGIPLIQQRLYFDLLAEGMLMSVLMAVLAGIGPTRVITRMQPAQAMRLDPAEALTRGRRVWIERLLPKDLPLLLRLPLRNVFRARRRAFSTWISIVFAFMLVLMSWGMLDSMNYMLDQNFHQIEQWDVLAVFAQPQTDATLKQIQQWDGVQEVTPALVFPATLKSQGKSKDVLITALPPDQTMHQWRLEGEITPEDALRDDGILLTPFLAKQLGLNVGDTLTVKTPFGEHQAVLRGIVDELYGTNAFVSLETAEAWAAAPMPVYTAFYLKASPERLSALKKDLFHLPGASSVTLKRDMEHDWRALMGLFYLFIGFLLFFALGMAFAVLFNAMTVNVLERERELATMRAVGAPIQRIAVMLALESVFVWVLAALPGMFLGWYVADRMMRAFSTELFSMQAHIYPHSYVLTALGVLITLLLASLPAIRRVGRLNLAEATKMLT
ncbi:MAG: FtsX-like permease family protein [Chloroflexi bacterium]|nr:FtsX-like permease family protein [Chloroflexota bacterium]